MIDKVLHSWNPQMLTVQIFRKIKSMSTILMNLYGSMLEKGD